MPAAVGRVLSERHGSRWAAVCTTRLWPWEWKEPIRKRGAVSAILENSDLELMLGLVLRPMLPMVANRYIEEHGISKEDLALVAVRTGFYGSLNPYSQFQKPVTQEGGGPFSHDLRSHNPVELAVLSAMARLQRYLSARMWPRNW